MDRVNRDFRFSDFCQILYLCDLINKVLYYVSVSLLWMLSMTTTLRWYNTIQYSIENWVPVPLCCLLTDRQDKERKRTNERERGYEVSRRFMFEQRLSVFLLSLIDYKQRCRRCCNLFLSFDNPILGPSLSCWMLVGIINNLAHSAIVYDFWLSMNYDGSYYSYHYHFWALNYQREDYGQYGYGRTRKWIIIIYIYVYHYHHTLVCGSSASSGLGCSFHS